MILVKHLIGLWRDKKGQTVVEAAFVLPIILIAIFGAIVIGLMVNTKLAASGAAREGARTWAIHQDTQRAKEVAEKHLKEAMFLNVGTTCSLSTGVLPEEPAPPGSVTSTGAGCRIEIDTLSFTDTSGNPEHVAVRVTYWQPTFVGGLLGLEPTTPVGSTAIFKIEN